MSVQPLSAFEQGMLSEMLKRGAWAQGGGKFGTSVKPWLLQAESGTMSGSQLEQDLILTEFASDKMEWKWIQFRDI